MNAYGFAFLLFIIDFLVRIVNIFKMKTIKNFSIIIFGFLMVTLTGCSDPIFMDESENATESKSSLIKEVALSDAEIEGILFMREEEKLAHDVYVQLYNKFGHEIFQNISLSEQTHMDAMLNLIDFYGLEDSASDELGVFNNAELKQLYADLMASATDYASALDAGVLIEETDITDINELIGQTTVNNLLLVYQHLVDGSERHLDAFNDHVEKLD